jgi:hypothetical protein
MTSLAPDGPAGHGEARGSSTTLLDIGVASLTRRVDDLVDGFVEDATSESGIASPAASGEPRRWRGGARWVGARGYGWSFGLIERSAQRRVRLREHDQSDVAVESGLQASFVVIEAEAPLCASGLAQPYSRHSGCRGSKLPARHPGNDVTDSRCTPTSAAGEAWRESDARTRTTMAGSSSAARPKLLSNRRFERPSSHTLSANCS